MEHYILKVFIDNGEVFIWPNVSESNVANETLNSMYNQLIARTELLAKHRKDCLE